MSNAIRSVLGFDYGQRRIGIAVGQTITGSATPLTTLNAINHKPDWQSIERLIQEWRPDALIVGVPVYFDGTASEMTRRAERFSRQLEGRFGIKVYCVNETLSSIEAESILKRQQKKPGRHHKHEVDKISAALIIETWLNQSVQDP